MNYEDYPEFNDHLDSIYSRVEIEEFSGLASYVLYEMDIEAYKLAYEDFLAEEKARFRETIVNNFPAPIAFYFSETESGFDNPNHQLHLLRSTWEAVIFTLYALTIGEVIHRNINLSTVRVFNNQRLRCNHNGLLSDKLGFKLEAVRAIVQYDKDALGASLAVTNIIADDTIDSLEELNVERNDFSHVAALDERGAEERFHLLFPQAYELLFNLRGLQKVSFIRYFRSLSAVKNVRFLRFDGHTLRKQNYDKTLTDEQFATIGADLSDDKLYLEVEEEIMCISPFAHIVDRDRAPALCFFKQVLRDTNEFGFEEIGTSVSQFKLDSALFSVQIAKLESLLT